MSKIAAIIGIVIGAGIALAIPIVVLVYANKGLHNLEAVRNTLDANSQKIEAAAYSRAKDNTKDIFTALKMVQVLQSIAIALVGFAALYAIYEVATAKNK